MKRDFRRWILPTAMVVGLLLLAADATKARLITALEQIDLLVDVRHEIVSQYVEEPDQQKMAEAAARAMVETLDDPYTVFLPPQDLEPFDKQIRGSFTGIGAEVELSDGHPRVTTPLDGSPAWKAGVLAGDIILQIDNDATDNMSLQEAIRHIQGPEGSTVVMKVRHPGGETAALTITRAQISVQTVKGMRRNPDQSWDFMLDSRNKIGYIRISQFTDNTLPGVKAALAQLKQAGMQGLILDLRFDPGGLLESAIQVADLFLPGGKRIVSVKGRVTEERVTMSTDSPDDVTVPLVVLANESSASASEIVTGALADNTRAKFIGTRTFGKGSVQQVRMLENGEGAIKITNAYYYLPSGRNIHKRKDKDVWGVDPDDGFYIAMTAQQQQTMNRIRRDADTMADHKNDLQADAVTPQRIETDLADPQLAGALKALVGKLTDHDWPKVGLSGAQALALEARRATLQQQRDLLTERLDQVDQELKKLDIAATQPATQPGVH